MTICIPTRDALGLDSQLSAHFGSAPHFALIEASTGRIDFMGRDGAAHSSSGCGSAAALGEREVDLVLCQGMGRRALANLEAVGIPVFVTEAATLGQALKAVRDGEVKRLRPHEACSEHGPEHEHGHGHQQGQGHGHGHGRSCCGGH